MKNSLFKSLFVGLIISFSYNGFSQTIGLLTLSYTPTSHSGYSGTKNVCAIWIQDANGAFVKSLYRRAGNGTKDHLPTWAVNSGGASNNCMASNCNVVSASTGATLTNYSQKILTWDGTDVTGSNVADGVYKITIESTWAHGTGGGAVRSFTFNKISTQELQSPADDANFTGISVNWVPTSSAGFSANELSALIIYPNPSSEGTITVDYEKATNVSIYDVLGKEQYASELEQSVHSKVIDVSTLKSGIYFVQVTDGTLTITRKVILE